MGSEFSSNPSLSLNDFAAYTLRIFNAVLESLSKSDLYSALLNTSLALVKSSRNKNIQFNYTLTFNISK